MQIQSPGFLCLDLALSLRVSLEVKRRRENTLGQSAKPTVNNCRSPARSLDCDYCSDYCLPK